MAEEQLRAKRLAQQNLLASFSGPWLLPGREQRGRQPWEVT